MRVLREVMVMREMLKQGVTNDLDLRGPLGNEIRKERRPMIEELVLQGKISLGTLEAMDAIDNYKGP